jgi:hypothetical protein
MVFHVGSLTVTEPAHTRLARPQRRPEASATMARAGYAGSGLSRSVSNLGSSLGTAIAGTVLVSDLASGNRSYALAMASLAAIGLIGLVAAMWLPSNPVSQQA